MDKRKLGQIDESLSICPSLFNCQASGAKLPLLCSGEIWIARPICLRLFWQVARLDASRTFCTAGISSAIKMAIHQGFDEREPGLAVRTSARLCLRVVGAGSWLGVPSRGTRPEDRKSTRLNSSHANIS